MWHKIEAEISTTFDSHRYTEPNFSGTLPQLKGHFSDNWGASQIGLVKVDYS